RERLLHDRLGVETPGPRCVHGRQTLPLAHVHPAVETEGTIERIERVIAGHGIKCVEFGGEPYGDPLPQNPAEMGYADADVRSRAAYPLGELPYWQPFLEKLRAIRDQKSDAAAKRRC